MGEIAELFQSHAHDSNRITQFSKVAEPGRRYIVAMTPRSGSSYLCSVLEGTRRLGAPGEFLNREFIPNIVKKIPGRNASEYLLNVSKAKKTRNGVFGVKASWFQFEMFCGLVDKRDLDGYRYIYLTRRNLAAQAVSLYKATASNVFHTNIKHEREALHKLEMLEYDFKKIQRWYWHIALQEQGWKEYFLKHRISPCYITYEEIDEDIESVVKRIGHFVGVNPDKITLPEQASIFSKVSDSRNMEWACRFMLEMNHKSI